jgi:outer membrane immunogenic protein
MRRVLIVPCIAAALATGGAAAADNFNWSGFYVGVQGGYGWGNGEHSIVSDGLAFLDPPFGPSDLTGSYLGVHGGWNHQMGEFVYGVEISGSWSEIDDFFDNVSGGDGYQTEIESSGSLKARLGYAPSSMPDFMGYVSAGVLLANVSAMNGDLDGSPPVFDCTSTGCAIGDGDGYGYTVGVGVSKAFDLSGVTVVLGLDYAYNDAGKIRIDTTTLPAGNPHVFEVDVSFHTVGGRLGVQF